jgi:hypothetical protein
MSNPNYYALIPASIRYDKDLSPSEKLFFAEITALTNMNGKCFASNSYFASLYGVANSTISLWVGNLAKKGHVDVDYIYDGKQITKRYISITNPMGLHQFTAEIGSQKSDGVVRKSEGGSQKIERGYSENPKDNNTLTESNTTPTESNKGVGVFDKIQGATDYTQLIPIWAEYRKTKGHYPNLYETEVIQNAWSKKDLATLKSEMLKAIENGWKSLVTLKESDRKEQSENKPYYKELT